MTARRTPHAMSERTLSLPTEALARIDGPATVRIVRGRIWLTVDGRREDHMLAPGEAFTLARGERALAQAIFAPGAAVVAEPVVRAWPWRLRRAWRVATHRMAEVFA